ncbi:MAG: NAD(P)H-hydrate dehydratase [Bacteroidetes bacterium]|nr:NAD(P)H-hydrate dehydratase [Bacteroidota bacterium]
MIPLYSIQQVRSADDYGINKLKIPGVVLMENAAINIFHSILEDFSCLTKDDVIGIVAGKGNNGGDGFALARHFINNGYSVTVISIARENELSGDAKTNYVITKNLLIEVGRGKFIDYKNKSDLNKLSNCSVIVDALLGTGTKGNIREPFASIISKLNSFNAFKVALDIPSGLDADKGSGKIVFEADLTITLAEYKKGLFFGKGYLYAGNVVKGGIGLGEEFFESLSVGEFCIEPEDAFLALPKKELDLHKYSAGKVLTVAGSSSLPGAAFLTAKSCFKTGAGSSVLAFPKSLKMLAQEKLDAATVVTYEDGESGVLSGANFTELKAKLLWADVIAIGPGLGRADSTLECVREIIKGFTGKKFIIDADAIYALSKKQYRKINLSNSILTPHHKEFAEMLGISIEELQEDLLKFGKKFCDETKSILVLKGAPTIIFNPDGYVFINTTGNQGMAKFGTGDVLTGVLAGLACQQNDLGASAIAGVYIHGMAADLLMNEKTIYGFTAIDLLEKIPYAIKTLIDSFIREN